MKRLWFALGALTIFFFANPGITFFSNPTITPNIDVRFQPPSPPDVCDCGTICKMHVTCDVPKCNGRLAHEGENQDSSDSPGDEVIEEL